MGKINRDDYIGYICDICADVDTFVYTRFVKIETFLEDVLDNMIVSNIVKLEVESCLSIFRDKHKGRFDQPQVE